VNQLQGTDFRVYFSFDIWTLPNHHAFFGLVGHWISATRDLITVLLGMECFRGPHTGANVAKIILKLLEQYGLRHKVGYFTTDNATNNETSIPELVKLFSNVNVAFNPVSDPMRSFGHVINLVLQAFPCGHNKDAVVRELATLDDDFDTMQKLQLWWKREPI